MRAGLRANGPASEPVSRKKDPAGLRLRSPESEPSLPVAHSAIAIRRNQGIFRIKMEKQANKEIMYADDRLPLASLPSTPEGLKEQKEVSGGFLPFQEDGGSGNVCSASDKHSRGTTWSWQTHFLQAGSTAQPHFPSSPNTGFRNWVLDRGCPVHRARAHSSASQSQSE